MNARVRKEIRQLAPAWFAALLLLMLLPFSLGWFSDTGIDPLHIAIFVIGLVFLSVASFGREFTSSTFQLFLSQPVSRRQLWREKTVILAIATFTLWLVYWAAFIAPHGFSLLVSALTLLGAFGIMTTGLWTSLLFRQVVPALCFSFLLPCLLYPFFELFLEFKAQRWAVVSLLLVPMAAYGAGGFVFARRLFVRAQDLPALQFSGLSAPRRRTKPAVSSRSSVRRRATAWTLALKEIRLQEVNIYCAVVLFVVLGALAAGFSIFGKKEAFEAVEIFFLLVLIFVPVLVGSTVIAEERKLGTLETHDGLPVSRRLHFLVKVGVTFVVILALAFLLPLIIIHGVSLIANVSIFDGYFQEAWEIIGYLTFAVFVGSVAFFFSSLSRNIPAALLGATVTLALGIVIFGWIIDPRVNVDAIVVMSLGAPAATAVLLVLAFRNYASSLIDFPRHTRVAARAAVWCVATIMVSGAALWLVLDVATGLKLRRAVSAWDQAGISMNVRDHLPPPVPRDENAAVILERVTATESDSEWERQPEPMQREIRGAHTIVEEILPHLEKTNVSPELLRELETALDQPDTARRLRIAREALEYDRFDAYPDFELGFELTLPQIPAMRHLARLLQAEAVLHAAHDHWEEAYGSLADSLHLGELLNEERFIISALTHVAVRQLTFRQLEVFLRTQPPHEEMLSDWLEMLSELHPIDLIESLVFNSVVTSQWILRRLDEGELRPSEYITNRGHRQSPFGEMVDKRVFRPLHRAGVATLLDWNREGIEVLRSIQQGESEPAALQEWEDRFEDNLPWYASWTSEFNVPGSRILTAGQRAQAELELARTGLAIHLYRATENEWPGSIDDLVPGYLSAIPRDPFDNEPLRYVREGDRVILYSVGLNRTDDRGTQVERIDPDQPGDIVWVLYER